MSRTLQKPDEILGRGLTTQVGRERLRQLDCELRERLAHAQGVERLEVEIELENIRMLEELRL